MEQSNFGQQIDFQPKEVEKIVEKIIEKPVIQIKEIEKIIEKAVITEKLVIVEKPI